ncbi:Zinc carboxypeptidase OS=Streptomyces alboniger OX=132473 GN=CP975_08265 PE=3 SV=1 [Streptomyces alboniger]
MRRSVEVYLTGQQADKLEDQGVHLTEHKLSAKAENRVEAAAEGVFRPYSGSGGLQEEIVRTGQENPGLTKVVSIGKTVGGQDILALKLTKGAKKSADGSKPSVFYMSNQHAREWITPEMTRRLMHHYLDNYKTDKRIKKFVDSTELWFVLSANPDGYDYTFENSDHRLWRKNLRDINGDGTISTGDGVDLNRNFAYKWGYDDEGSSPDSDQRDLPRRESRLRAGDQGPGRLREAGRFHLRRQLPLRRRTPSLRGRLAGGHGHPRRRRSTRRSPAPPTTPRSRATTRRSPRSCTPPTVRPTATSAANVNGMALFTPEMSDL